jgi:hypothetical protein
MPDFETYKEVPPEIRKRMVYTGAVYVTPSESIRFECERYEWKDGILTLRNALADTSYRVRGVQLDKKVTQRDEINFGGHISWMIRPLAAEEE